MVKDKTKLRMRILRFISLISIGVGLWVLIGQIVYDYDSFDITPVLPFLFAGWVGDHAYRVVSALSDRISELEKQSGV